VASPEHVIVVDDDSTDGTEAVVAGLGTRYIKVRCHSMGGAKNAGLAHVDTPYVTFLDDDDAWLPGNMEEQLHALESHPAAAFAYGVVQCATPALEPLPYRYPAPPLPSGHVPRELHLAYPQLGVVLFRRSALLEVHGFDATIPYHQDGDVLLRLAARHEILGIEAVGMLHAIRPPSRDRADYLWGYRATALWMPRGFGLGWRTHARYVLDRKSHWFHRLMEDAAASVERGQRWDGIVCIARATWVSPPHAARHARMVLTIARSCLAPRASRRSRVSGGDVDIDLTVALDVGRTPDQETA
jgi:glycosyltransferase involved in cell wall biosynthesis